MNATPMNLNPGNPVQALSQSGKPADPAASETPFSQVLSGEIAQSRKNDEPREDADTGTDPASQATRPAGADKEAAAQAKPGEESTRDPLAPSPAGDAAVAPETLLALAINPDQFRPTPAGTGITATEAAPALDAAALPAPDARKGRAQMATQALQAGQHAESAHGTQKIDIDPAQSGKADLHAATTAAATAASASAFSGQLAAARQPDAVKTGEVLSDLMSNPAMRAAPHTLDPMSAPAEAASSRLAPAVGTTAWGQALGEKLVWMAGGSSQQTASLTLNPPNMGPLQIVINVTNDQATASFFSAQPEVRQALESAFPKLREMMNEAGIQLGQATVSADTPKQNDPSDRQAQRIVAPFVGADDGVPASLQSAQAPTLQSGRGLVDTFA